MLFVLSDVQDVIGYVDCQVMLSVFHIIDENINIQYNNNYNFLKIQTKTKKNYLKMFDLRSDLKF